MTAAAASRSAVLYPATPPRRTRGWPVPDGHQLHVQELGVADGLPALVLHGGPGSGCSPLLWRVFDPARYRVICIDQRGAGASMPAGRLAHNTTAHLLQDLRALREMLGVTRWLVLGGSWGATLALAHAADAPQAVAALLLRAPFLGRPDDVTAFFAGSGLQLAALAQQLHGDDAAQQAAAARAWWAWEQQRVLGSNGQAMAALPEDQLTRQIQRYRVQAHYLMHGCWLQPPLLQRCAAVPAVPTLLLQGDDDAVCPPTGALELQARLPHARLQRLAGVGHDAAHPAMLQACVDALDAYAARGSFDGAPA